MLPHTLRAGWVILRVVIDIVGEMSGLHLGGAEPEDVVHYSRGYICMMRCILGLRAQAARRNVHTVTIYVAY